MRPGCKKHSLVWNWFKKIDSKQAVCKICNKIIKYFGGTTNLKQHFLRIHPTIKLEISPNDTDTEQSINEASGKTIEKPGCSSENIPTPTSESETITLSSSSAEPSSATSEVGILNRTTNSTNAKIGTSISSNLTKKNVRPQKQLKLFGMKERNKLLESKLARIDSALLKMVVKDYQPLSLVEDEGFLEYTRELEPRYTPPSRKKLTYDILPKRYEEAASELQNMLHKVDNVAVSTDMWTSDSTRGYLTVTCHFIYNDRLTSRVLATNEIVGSHTGENIANALTNIFNKWNIANKIVTVVSDNGANIKKAINDFLQKHHHPCIAHTLHLSITEALSTIEELDKILKKCRALVGYFKHSVLANDKLKNVQEQMGLPKLKVKQEVPTRWNSTFIMIERLLCMKNPLSVVVTNLSKSPEFLDAEEWKVLEDCLEMLQPANELSTVFSGEKYPTMSLVIPLIRGFQIEMRYLTTQTGIGEELRKKILDTVTRRLAHFETNKIASKACFLDPRFKKYGFGSEENANSAQRQITEELTALISKKEELSRRKPEDTRPRSDVESIPKKSKGIWAHLDQKLSGISTFSTPPTMATLMVRQYLELAPLEKLKTVYNYSGPNKS